VKLKRKALECGGLAPLWPETSRRLFVDLEADYTEVVTISRLGPKRRRTGALQKFTSRQIKKGRELPALFVYYQVSVRRQKENR